MYAECLSLSLRGCVQVSVWRGRRSRVVLQYKVSRSHLVQQVNPCMFYHQLARQCCRWTAACQSHSSTQCGRLSDLGFRFEAQRRLELFKYAIFTPGRLPETFPTSPQEFVAFLSGLKKFTHLFSSFSPISLNITASKFKVTPHL